MLYVDKDHCKQLALHLAIPSQSQILHTALLGCHFHLIICDKYGRQIRLINYRPNKRSEPQLKTTVCVSRHVLSFFFAKESKWSLIYCTKGSFSVEQFCVVCSRGSFVVSIAILGQHFRRDSVYVSAAHSDVSQLCLTAMLQHSRTETNQHVDFYPLFFWVSSAFIIRNLPPAPWHVDKAIVVEESKYLRYLQVWWTSVKQPKGKIRHTTRQQMLIGEFSAAK